MKLTIRQINHLNKLAKKNLVVFDGWDGQKSLNKIRFLKRGEDGAEDDMWAVYNREMKDWYFLGDCKFFVLTPYPK